MGKDRLAELKARNGESGRNEEEEILMTEVKVNTHFAELSSKTVAIQDSLQESHSNIVQIKSLHTAILSSPTHDPSSKGKIESLMHSIKKSMTKTSQDLKSINKATIEAHQKKKISDTEFRMISTVQASLTAQFQQVFEDMCEARNSYEGRCRQRIQRQLEIAGYNMTEAEKDEAMNGGIPIFSKEFAECEAAKQALRDLEERHQDLLALEKSIVEMHDMFLELNLLVAGQGEIVDRIEDQVVNAGDKVKDGVVELGEARTKQASARKKKCICISVGVFIVLFLLAAIVLSAIYS